MPNIWVEMQKGKKIIKAKMKREIAKLKTNKK